MKKPNLFIVGAARSGTTLFWNYLKGHPAVYMPDNLRDKEPAHFSELKKSRFGRIDVYEGLFENANEEHKWVGEASTAYLTDSESSYRISEYNPESRIIIILRSPDIRAHSLYRWMVQKGYEYAASFEKALQLEHYRSQIKIPNYYEMEYFYNYMYFGSGLYFEQVKRYQNLFHERVLLLRLEDFISDPIRELKKLCEFLAIDYHPAPLSPINRSVLVKSAAGQFVLRKLTRALLSEHSFQSELEKNSYDDYQIWLSKEAAFHIEALRRVFGITKSEEEWVLKSARQIASEISQGKLELKGGSIEGRDKLLELGHICNDASTPISEETMLSLKERYRTDVNRLSELMQVDFSNWLL